MTDELQRLQRALAGHYRIERVVGRGGMATVYLAKDQRHQRDVAIKVVRPDLAAVLGPERFLHEIRVTANLAHPHILPLHDSGVADGLLYYVMPFVVGESLRARLDRDGTLPLADAMSVAGDVADALSYAHRKGVVHRDVKPGNVLLSEGHAMVTDFGIAKAVSSASGEQLTQTGVGIGTPGYMSPEQAAGATDVSAQSDVYSLACVIHEMLVGSVPARWLSHEEWEAGRFLRASPAQRARFDALPAAVEPALVHAMAIDPARRPATANDLVRALASPAPPGRRYSGAEARELLGRAAALEAAEPDATAGFSLTGVRRIAAEVDIPTRHVMAAAAALDQPVMAPVAAPTSRILGLPAGWQVSRSVDFAVSDREFPALLDIVQETMGTQGVVETTLPGVFAWASAVGEDARRAGGATRVQVSPRAGRTKITVSSDHSLSVVGATAAGAVLAGMLAMFMGNAGAASVSLPAIGVVGVGAVFLVRRAIRARRERLEALLERITNQLARAIPPQLPRR
ncbi:MAG: protein kinase [Gemmatimonadota bacterium]|nr:protein kinase [Gemmatimonadota bacterium]